MQQVLDLDALFGVFLQDGEDEVAGGIRDFDPGWECDLVVDDAVELALPVDFEGEFADDELVRENADCPDVDALVVHLSLDHFRREVQRCAAASLPESFCTVHRPPKIT